MTFSSRKKHFRLKNQFPVSDIIRLADLGLVDAQDGLLVVRSRSDTETKRRLINDTIYSVNFRNLLDDIANQVAALVIYPDIAARNADPASQQIGVLSYVIDARADPDIGNRDNPTWALYNYESGQYNNLTNQETSTYDSDVPDANTAVATAGTILEGQSTAGAYKGLTFSKMMDTMLFVENPTAALNTLGLASDVTGTVEVGLTQSWQLTATYNPGAITNGDGSGGPNLTGDATIHTFTGPDGVVITVNPATANTEVVNTASYTVVEGANAASVTTDYALGVGAYTDGLGNNSNVLDTLRIADSRTANLSVTGAFNRWYEGYGPLGASPTASGAIRAITNETFSNSFRPVIGQDLAEWSIYVPDGLDVRVQVVSTFSIIIDSASPVSNSTNTAVTVADAGGTNRAYRKHTALIGSADNNGFISDQEVIVTIS